MLNVITKFNNFPAYLPYILLVCNRNHTYISLRPRILMRLAKALIRLHVCTGSSEALLVAHITLLEISCTDTLKVSLISRQCLSCSKQCYFLIVAILISTIIYTECDMTKLLQESYKAKLYMNLTLNVPMAAFLVC